MPLTALPVLRHAQHALSQPLTALNAATSQRILICMPTAVFLPVQLLLSLTNSSNANLVHLIASTAVAQPSASFVFLLICYMQPVGSAYRVALRQL